MRRVLFRNNITLVISQYIWQKFSIGSARIQMNLVVNIHVHRLKQLSRVLNMDFKSLKVIRG